MISPLFTTIVLLSAFIWIYMKITVKNVNKGTDEFLERERQANLTRKQPLTSLEYIHFSESSIPFVSITDNEHVNELQDSLKDLMSKNIVNLTGITNTDLKLTYGVQNLPILTEYDQNFTALCKNIFDLGMEYLASGHISEATKVFSYGISIGTDISGNYIALANIYIENNDFEKINELIFAANNINSLTKNSTISKLNNMLTSHNTMSVPIYTAPIPAPSNTENIQLDASVTITDTATSEPFDVDPGSILPKDILDILETAPYISDDQK